MILMTIKASLFSLFQQPEQKKEQLKPGMEFHGVCGVLFCFGRTNICYATIRCIGGLENESAFAGLLGLQTLGPRQR